MKKLIVIDYTRNVHTYRFLSSDFIYDYFEVLFVTSDYFKSNLIDRLILKFLSSTDKKKFISKTISKLSLENVITVLPYSELFLIFVRRSIPFEFIIRHFEWMTNKMRDYFACKTIIKENPDIIWAYGYHGLIQKRIKKYKLNTIWIQDLAGASPIYFRDQIMPKLIAIHDDNNSNSILHFYNEYYVPEMRILLDNSDFFLVPSNYVASSLIFDTYFLKKSIESLNYCVIPHGIQSNNYCRIPSEITLAQEVKFLYVGRVVPQKGVALLVDAFNQLKSKDYNISLTIVGDFSLYKDSKMAREIIRFTGPLSGDELMNEFLNHHVFVSPSYSDGFSNAVGEAIGYGLPVIISNNVGLSDLIVNYVSGIKFNIDNPIELIEAMIWFNDNKSKYETLSIEACKLAAEYSWEKYVLSTYNYFKSITSLE
jgi:glycosyltransferase involved in cell wall biosynthesis